MCLLVFAWQHHPEYRLILAGNRDEFFVRPSRQACWWRHPTELLAGRDLKAGGTWLGINRGGRFGVVTNFREMGNAADASRSRGHLIPAFLGSADSVDTFFDELSVRREELPPFSLIFGDMTALHYLSNRADPVHPIPPGIHGLSNHALDTPWPKITRTRARFENLLEAADVDSGALFEMLADRSQAGEKELPKTGLSKELEKRLSSPFITTPTYGTRCSTILTVRNTGAASFMERSFERDGTFADASTFEFQLAV